MHRVAPTHVLEKPGFPRQTIVQKRVPTFAIALVIDEMLVDQNKEMLMNRLPSAIIGNRNSSSRSVENKESKTFVLPSDSHLVFPIPISYDEQM